jgi:16S rRNA (cytidine1402-2'-O)-methyltransferase
VSCHFLHFLISPFPHFLDPMPGTLYIVATPIGNLEDISARALRILREAALIAAEDTRVTRKLLAHFGIHTPMISYHAHSGGRQTEVILKRLAQGEAVALVSDAGTPAISDPGAILVRAALEAGETVTPIPGPSALVTALCASGLDTSRFVFEGFLPRKAGERRKLLEGIRSLPHTLVFYESPERLADTLAGLQDVLGDRPGAVARELTKKFEEFARGPLSALAARFRETGVRGECVILVAGGTGEEQRPPVAGDLDERLMGLLGEGVSVRDAARITAQEYRRPRKETYARAMELAGKQG